MAAFCRGTKIVMMESGDTINSTGLECSVTHKSPVGGLLSTMDSFMKVSSKAKGS